MEAKDLKSLGIDPCKPMNEGQSAAAIGNEARDRLGSFRLLRKGNDMRFPAIRFLRSKIAEIGASPVGRMKN